MVLGGNEDALRARDPDGVVRAAVAERELERLEAEGEPDELVAEADAEEGDTVEEIADGLDRSLELGGVTRTVPDENGGRFELEHGVCLPRPGDDHGLHARLDEPADDRAFAAEVEDGHARARPDRERLRDARFQRGRGRSELGLRQHPRPVEVRLDERAGMEVIRRGRPERAPHRAVRAQPAHERARVDLLERDDAPLREPRPTTRAWRGA